jgi:hypothetical protein
MANLRSRVARLARAAAAGDSAGRLMAIIAHGHEYATVRADRWAMSLVVPWSEALERGGADAAVAALTAAQRDLIRPQDSTVILSYPPGSDPPRIGTCGL